MYMNREPTNKPDKYVNYWLISKTIEENTLLQNAYKE